MAKAFSRNSLAFCDVDGCAKHRRNDRSKYCVKHYNNKRQTGDPKGNSLLKSTLRPIIKEASRYIDTNHEALPIAGGLRWAGAWLLAGQNFGDDWSAMTHQQIADTLIFRQERSGLEPLQVLATLTACRYLWDHEAGTFKSEDHFRYQTGKALLHMISYPLVRITSCQGVERRQHLRPAPKVIDLAYKSVPMEAHNLASGIAHKLHEPWDWKVNTMNAMKQTLPRINHLQR